MDEREERFTRLFGTSYGRMWAYARRRVPADDVDDVVAEIFAVAWRRLEDIPNETALAWLYGIGHRTIANSRRSRSRRLRLIKRLAAEPSPSTGSAEDAEVTDALARLRADDQEVLRLAAWEGLEPADIALVLGCSPNAAALRLSRARKKLREQLTGSTDRRTHGGRKEIDV